MIRRPLAESHQHPGTRHPSPLAWLPLPSSARQSNRSGICARPKFVRIQPSRPIFTRPGARIEKALSPPTYGGTGRAPPSA